MTFLDKYKQCQTWQEKVTVMELYYLSTKEVPGFKLEHMAKYFEVSVGLVSENLKLARAMHDVDGFIKITSRSKALKLLLGSWKDK
jgi:hypothetical protein